MHQGVLRRKKQRRSLFESAYKQVVLCRLEASVLRGSKRVRVYLHEREREREREREGEERGGETDRQTDRDRDRYREKERKRESVCV